MLYVKTKVLPSPIEGLGLYADEFIPKGTILWKFTPGFDIKFSADELNDFPELVQQFLLRYAYKSKRSNLYVLAVDDAKYFNHSSSPNTNSEYAGTDDEVTTRAIVDIQKGEEMTDDYDLFEENATALL